MSDDLIRRPLPILMSHFPSAPAVDFNDIDQRIWLRCSCGVDFRDRDHRRVMENWALHAMQHMETCADTIARLTAELAEARAEKKAAYTVGFAAGIEGAAKRCDEAKETVASLSGSAAVPFAAMSQVIRSITPPDVTQAAARVLLAMTDAGRDGEIGPWLRALAEGGEHE